MDNINLPQWLGDNFHSPNTSDKPITNALSAIHAIAHKKGFAAEEITSVRPDGHNIWLYSLTNNPTATFSINLSTE